MIEYADKSKRVMTYDEALLYCAFCNHGGIIGWRLPTEEEYRVTTKITGWYKDRLPEAFPYFSVTPVRDI